MLDKTSSTFLYVLYLVVYFLPKIVCPMIAGPYLDNFSRRKVIYLLDFLCGGLFLLFYLILRLNYYNYVVYLALAAVLGAIDSIYEVAYDSLYPMLVDKANFSKAYSISSMIYPLAAMMVPVATYVYKRFGVAPLFAFNALTFLVAALFETQIRVDESQIQRHSGRFRLRDFTAEFKGGLRYIRGEKGLLIITLYFAINNFTGGSFDTLMLPYFKSTAGLGVMLYSLIGTVGLGGRLIGGALHYKFELPHERRFAIALAVYVFYTIANGVFLFLPVWAMFLLQFALGLMGVTSYNIRIAATQGYVPNHYRARFNSCFQILCTIGIIGGQLTTGALAESYSIRLICLVSACLNMVAVWLLMYCGRRYVKPIYNDTLAHAAAEPQAELVDNLTQEALE